MGRVLVEIKIANRFDVQLAAGRGMPIEEVRQTRLQAVVDTRANYLILPTAVAVQLGLPEAGEAVVRYADGHTGTKQMVDQAEIEVLGRKGTFRALLEPDRTTALLGAIVLEDLDFLVDCGTQRLYPRDPHRIIAEVE